MRWLLLFMAACRGCQPELPSTHNPDKDSPRQDSDSPADTQQETDSPADTQAPLFCDLPETEPNDTLATAIQLPMEQWICGTVDHPADADFYSITTTEPGWVTLELKAASMGSSADMDLALTDASRSVVVYDSYLSTDPRITFPADTPGTYLGWMSENNPLASGENYTWYFRASISKPSIGWSREEVEPNGPTQEKAEEFTINDRVFGVIADSADIDWYHVVTPEDATAIILDVKAFELGSPLDSTLVIRDAAGKAVKTVYSGEIDYDLDPHLEMKVEGSQDWYVEIYNPSEKGSNFHWYTLSITAEY